MFAAMSGCIVLFWLTWKQVIYLGHDQLLILKTIRVDKAFAHGLWHLYTKDSSHRKGLGLTGPRESYNSPWSTLVTKNGAGLKVGLFIS